MLPSRIASACVLAVALGPLAAGCGDGAPSFDPAAAYTPESLAAELAYRYKALNPDVRNVPRPRPARKPDAAATKEAQAATKEARATTLDDLVREVATKAESIPGMAPAEAIRRVADAVGKDASLAAADRKTIADRLRPAGE